MKEYPASVKNLKSQTVSIFMQLTFRIPARFIEVIHWLVFVNMLAGLVFIPSTSQAKMSHPLAALSADQVRPLFRGLGILRQAVGDPLPRIICSGGYRAEVYAEGLSSPDGLAFSPAGLLYVAEDKAAPSGKVRRIETNGSKTTVASGLDGPEGIAFDNAGNLYVVEDVENGRLLKIAPDGAQTTLAGSLDAPEGVVWRSDGMIFFTVSTAQFAGSIFDVRTEVKSIVPPNSPTTINTVTFVYSFAGITLGPDGSLYVTNEASGTGTNDSVIKITGGSHTTFATNLTSPEGLRFSAGGGFPLYVAEEDTGGGAGRLSKISSGGSRSTFCTGFFNIEDVIVDSAGQFYISEDTTGLIILISDETSPTATTTPTPTQMGTPTNTASATYTATATSTPALLGTVLPTYTATPTVEESTPTKIYLPLIVKSPRLTLPDLIIDSLLVSSDAVTVVVRNQGDQSVVDAFWVDVYINPDPPMTEQYSLPLRD